MGDFLSLMVPPLVACLLLSALFTYLGYHVVERGVIFVDLAMAQIAALGATVAFLLGYGLHGMASYSFGLGFALAGAAIFALTRMKEQRVPQEAIIGVVYAVSAAAAIVILSRAAEGAEEIKAILVGNILLVDPQELLAMLGIYTVIGLLHWWWRKPLLLISQEPAKAAQQGVPIRRWDFVFYVSLGVAVTTAVPVAGVLLVFSFLVVPAVCAMLLARRLIARLLLGWLIGVIASVGGVSVSFLADFPTGATIVCVFGVVLALVAGAKTLVSWTK